VLSLRLTASQLTDQAEALGISGVPWKLPLPAFSGSLISPGQNQGELAADTVGTGSVRVSPLDMALVAGAVDSGSWRAPVLVTGPSTERSAKAELSPSVVSQLRELMRTTVKSGVAKAANRPGVALYGQVGTAPLPGHQHLRAIWFVGFQGNVAFAVLVFTRSTAFTPAVQIARAFAAGLPKS
jgi:cell division protein FtsI/penicillin-binding protein 2